MSISDAVPVSVMVVVPDPEIFTPPEDEAVKLPAPAAIVRVKLAPVESESERVRADRSTLDATSSVTVTVEGRLETVGASLTLLMLTFTVPVAVLFAPAWSLAVMVKVSALVPKLFADPVYWMLDAVFR